MENVILVIHLFLAIAIIILVLIQRSEGGGLGIGGSGGGGGLGGFASGRQTANALTKATAFCAAAFFCTSLVLGILAAQNSQETTGILDNIAAEIEQNTQEENDIPAMPEVPLEEAPAEPSVPISE